MTKVVAKHPRVFSFLFFFIKGETPPPPYFHWNYTISGNDNTNISYGNIVYSKKGIDDIDYKYINVVDNGDD